MELQFLCPSLGVIHCTFGTGTCYTDLTTACVQDQDGTPDDGQRNCPKHVEFRTRINLEISASVIFSVKKFITVHGQ
jgi:hypothetical protein